MIRFILWLFFMALFIGAPFIVLGLIALPW